MNTGKTKYPPAEYFLQWQYLKTANCYRWIEHKGWVMEKFMGQVTILSALGTKDVLDNPLCFGTDKRKCMFTKEKLNSEYVKSHEPECWKYPSWQEAYQKTHKIKNIRHE